MTPPDKLMGVDEARAKAQKAVDEWTDKDSCEGGGRTDYHGVPVEEIVDIALDACGLADTMRENERLLGNITILQEALTSIAITAQQASMHEPAQFCEWAYTCASGALNQQDPTKT